MRTLDRPDDGGLGPDADPAKTSGTGDPRAWSAEQLSAVLAAVSDGVTVQDRRGALVFANEAACRLLGCTDPLSLLRTDVADVIGSYDVLDEDGAELPVSALPGRRALEGELEPERLLRFRIRGTREERWARVSARPIRAADGTVELAVNTFRDVTESMTAERRLRFEADLLDEVEAAVVATDADGRITHWNRSAQELFGWARELAVGRFASDLHWPSGVAGTPSPLPGVAAGHAWEGELSVRRPDGRETLAYLALNPVRQRDGAARVAGVVGVAVDATARERAEAELRISEERYRTLANSLPHIVVTAGPDGRFDGTNERFEQYTGFSLAEVTADGWKNVLHPADRTDLFARLQAAFDAGREFEAEYRLRRADGAYRWHMLRALPLRSGRKIAAWIATSTDIDDRKRAERGLAFLAEASRVLNGSLDYEETLAAVADLAVPEIADWCRVDLRDDEGRLQNVAVSHVDPGKVSLARDLNRRFPTDPNTDRGVAAVLRTGRSQLIADIPERLIDETVASPELRDILRRLGLRSSMIVPLVADGRPIGAISFVAAESGRRFDDADLALAEDLARRAVAAIDNARLYRRVSQFKGAVDNSTDCVFMFDPRSLRFGYVNRAAVDQVGYTADELLRMTPLDLKPEFDEASYRELIDPLVRAETSSRRFQTVQRRKDGVDIPVDVVLQRIPVEPDGAGRIIAFVRDVTERVEAQSRLQALAQAERTRAAEVVAVIRAMGEAVVVFDSSGCVTLANPAAESQLGGGEVACYDDLVRLFEGADPPRLGVDHAQGPVELRLRGQRRWLEATSYPVLLEPTEASPDARSVHAGDTILVMRDVTAQREEAAMREAFIGVLSHELRTPVTTIYGGSKVLGRGDGRLSDETRQEVYADIEAEAERLFRLVEDLLVLARFGEEPVTFGDEPVLLQRILPGVVASEQSRWPSTRFDVEIASGLPTVRADATYVEQVARNLLANGAKYGPQGGAVELRVEPSADGVRVSVRDQGPGFPEDESDRLFELFYRSPGTAAQAAGAGIGLFVARRLIEAMGGRIWARNLAGGGAEFGFTLARFDEDE